MRARIQGHKLSDPPVSFAKGDELLRSLGRGAADRGDAHLLVPQKASSAKAYMDGSI
jgi:hypothetical protein